MVVVGHADTHAGVVLSVFVVRDPGGDSHFVKPPPLTVAEKLLWIGIIGDEDVGPAVTVEIDQGHAETLARMSGDACCR